MGLGLVGHWFADQAAFDPAYGFSAAATLTSQGGRYSNPSLLGVEWDSWFRVVSLAVDFGGCCGFLRLWAALAGLTHFLLDPFKALKVAFDPLRGAHGGAFVDDADGAAPAAGFDDTSHLDF